MRVICAWCERVITEGEGDGEGPLSHGMCAECAAGSGLFPVQDLSNADPHLLDTLPFGAIHMLEDGEIVAYNKAESELSGLEPGRVIGKNFFKEVAPCTAVKEFQGRLEAMRREGRPAREQFDFAFKFPGGAVIVKLALTYWPGPDAALLLVERQA